jgi:hypothetical protein
LSPFFKGGILSAGLKPLFGKEGKGRFFAEAGRNYVANFWVTTLALGNPDESRTSGGQAWERILTSVLKGLRRKIATSLSIAIVADGFLLTIKSKLYVS